MKTLLSTLPVNDMQMQLQHAVVDWYMGWRQTGMTWA
jgi:hypothetical protein